MRIHWGAAGLCSRSKTLLTSDGGFPLVAQRAICREESDPSGLDLTTTTRCAQSTLSAIRGAAVADQTLCGCARVSGLTLRAPNIRLSIGKAKLSRAGLAKAKARVDKLAGAC